MNLQKTSIVLLLVAVVLVSGCSGGGSSQTSVSGPGVVITSFDSDFSEVDSSQPVFVTIDFENQGDFDATNLEATLLRKGGFKTRIANNNSPDNGDFFTSLEKPLEGVFSSEQYYWQLTAPRVSQDRVEEVQARLSYDYTTEAFATIHFVPRDTYLEQGGETAFLPDVTTSAGPIELDLTMNQPVILTNAETNSLTSVTKLLHFTVLLSNVGGGTAVAPSGCGNGQDCVRYVWINTTGTSCTDTTLGYQAGNSTDNVKLIRGTDGRANFDFNVTVSAPAAATSCQVHVRAEYTYQVDSPVLPITALEAI